MYENAQTIVGHLNAIEEGRKAISKNQTTIDREKKKFTEELTPVYEKAKEEAQRAKNTLEREIPTKESSLLVLAE